jgi:hypothetical protein
MSMLPEAARASDNLNASSTLGRECPCFTKHDRWIGLSNCLWTSSGRQMRWMRSNRNAEIAEFLRMEM